VLGILNFNRVLLLGESAFLII